MERNTNNILIQLQKLAAYYRDIIVAFTDKGGRHLHDLSKVRSGAILSDLAPFIGSWRELLESDEISISLPRVSLEEVSKVVSQATQEEEAEGQGSNNKADDVGEPGKEQAAESLLAMYRKQEQDPYNRETLIGFPIISGTSGSVHYCAPLFYFRVRLEYEPLRDTFRFLKESQTPDFNTPLLADLVDEEGVIDVVRRFILTELHGEEFNALTVTKIVDILARVVPALRGLRRDSRDSVPVTEAISAAGSINPTVFHACIVVNARKTHTFLLDELAELKKLEDYTGGTAVDAFLSEVVENVEEIDDPDSPEQPTPLFFPLESNLPQRRAARKAERGLLTAVEGPPGTGKSQTIANIVCHLVAQGHTVLVTSHQNKALEVAIEKLPKLENETERDYLTMAMLKGEAESARQLADKLKHFDATVAAGSRRQLELAVKEALNRVEENLAEMRRLRVRFSELKNIERQAASQGGWHYRYDDIRDYDGIHLTDHVSEEDLNAVGDALGIWSGLMEGLSAEWRNLYSLLAIPPDEDTGQVTQRVTLLKELATLCREAETLAQYALADRVLDMCSADHPLQIRKALAELDEWLIANRDKLLGLLAVLARPTGPSWGSRETLALLRQWGVVPPELGQEATAAEEHARRLTSIPPTGPDGVPTPAQVKEVEYAVAGLQRNAKSWFRWHLSWGCRRHRSCLEKADFVRLDYRACSEQLATIRLWVNHWQARYAVVAFLHHAQEIGLPVDSGVQSNSPPVTILREAARARACVELLNLLAGRPRLHLTPSVESTIEPLLEGVTDVCSLELVLNILSVSVGHQDRILRLTALRQEPSLAPLWSGWLQGWDSFISRLKTDATVAESIGRVEELLAPSENFIKILELEQGSLASLPRTLDIARARILAGDFPAWLRQPPLAVEAHRLRQLIHGDLNINPDDIGEVARRLRGLGLETRQAIVQVLRRQRRLALWQAAHDNRTRTEIDKLRGLLKKKRKTLSLVELRDQVNYQALLKVFPCWVMGIEDVARVFPLEAGLFDYVIVDEASQCAQATALHLAYRGQRMVVVGDEKQLQNPWVRFLREGDVQLLLQKHNLHKHPKSDVFNAKVSLLGLATRCSNSREFLNEHFRSEPAIIAWSNKHFYSNHLQILTPIWPRRFEPCMELRLIRGADDDPEDTKTNQLEAKAVIAELRRLLEDPEYEGLTFGVISPFRPQADLLQDLIYRELADHPEWIHARRLVASTADGFQGDERDIILYSMRYGPSSKAGSIHAIENEEERLNVAFTRARRKVICFVSLPPDQFPWPAQPPREKSIRGFLERALTEQHLPMGRLGAERGDRFDSKFEQDVCQGLRSGGFKVYTQVPCAGYWIDLVLLDDEGRRLAVECDGDFHYEEGYLRPEDYHRQDIIERAGWSVHRVSFRRFYANPEVALGHVMEALLKQPTESETLVRDVEQVPEGKAPSEILHPKPIPETSKGEPVPYPPTEALPSKQPIEGENAPLEGAMAESKNWFAMSHWGKETEKLIPFDRGFAFNIGRYLSNHRDLSPKQTRYGRQVWKKAMESGFAPSL